MGHRLGRTIGLALLTLLTVLNMVSAKEQICTATIFPAIMDEPTDRGSDEDFSSLDWSYKDLPLIAIEDHCSLSSSDIKTFINDEAETILVSSSDYEHQGYFFYVGHCGDNVYCISWNGHQSVNHARWLITESALLSHTQNQYCFEDPKVSICIN